MNRWLTYCFLLLATSPIWGQTFEYRTYYDKEKTQLKEIINLTVSDSTLHGLYSSFMQNGAPKAAGFYEHGKASGMWTYYFEDNRIRAKGELDNGKQHGLWSYYYESGNLKSEGYMKGGIREGEWTNYYENGEVKSSGIYLGNKKDASWKYFFEDGELKAETLFHEGVGVYREVYDNGQTKVEGQIRDEKSEGLWKYYYPGGQLESEGNYKNGLRVGNWTNYHENGQISSQGYYNRGKKSGDWIYYYETGSISSRGTLVDDVREGQWNLFFQNGEVQSSTDYNHGDGLSTEYYPGGQIMAKGHIVNGKKEGHWEYYDVAGFKNGEAEFENGIGQFIGYYQTGIISMRGKLENSRQVGEWILYDIDGEISGKYKPLYEDTNSTQSSTPFTPIRTSKKPEYRYKKQTNRYFDVVTNEFRGIGIATNPIWTVTGFLPISIEYYIQERLSYELIYTHYRDPFYVSTNDIQLGDIYRRGHAINLRQKFLSKDRDFGMPYFGHGISFNTSNYNVDIINAPGSLTATETIASYGLFAGLKWMRSKSRRGFYVDLYAGMDIGLRNWNKEYSASDNFDTFFSEIEQKNLYLPFTFGVNFGWMSSLKRIKRTLNGR